jgi:flavin reductase (DIM6/NTAB) family NADH-FMN oxidoreductase RutF
MTLADSQRPVAAALGRIPSGLFIVTVRRGDMETGMLASWVQQCSFSPPMISVALERSRPFASFLAKQSPFTVNILDETQTDMISHFGRGFEPGEPAFEGLDVERGDTNGPVLSEALAFLEAKTVERCSAGDHELILAEVVGGRLLSEGHPMVHVRKNGFHY